MKPYTILTLEEEEELLKLAESDDIQIWRPAVKRLLNHVFPEDPRFWEVK